ncbi:MAG: hypothetical protein U1C74_25240 [Phenylobacterium sp.]|nr:hypothetical protein [Phenylobacterium sp.]
MTTPSDIQGLSDLGECAYALGMVFGRRAQDEADLGRMVRYVELFERCFHGFRVSVALKLRLAREARIGAQRAGAAPSAPALDHPETVERADSGTGVQHEREAAETTLRLEEDRDREPVSLPILLKTLGGVVAGAETLPGPPPAELLTPRELLARMTSAPPPRTSRPTPAASGAGVALLTRPTDAPAQGGRAQRLLSGAAPLAPPGGPRDGATGPPIVRSSGAKPPWLR